RRRRHTRSDRDWSSAVCSSDLPATTAPSAVRRKPDDALVPLSEPEPGVPAYRTSTVNRWAETSRRAGVTTSSREPCRAHPAAVQIGRAACRERAWGWLAEAAGG